MLQMAVPFVTQPALCMRDPAARSTVGAVMAMNSVELVANRDAQLLPLLVRHPELTDCVVLHTAVLFATQMAHMAAVALNMAIAAQPLTTVRLLADARVAALLASLSPLSRPKNQSLLQ